MKISDIILIILAIISVAIGIWYLLGGSPTFEQTLLVFILTVLFANSIKISDINTRLKMLENSFFRLAKDFKEYMKA